MSQEPDLATIASLIGEQTRAFILSALLSGEALPASELAYRAHVTPQTASAHLTKLLGGNLIKVTQTGRHRYYSLRNHEVAQMLEALQLIAPLSKSNVTRKNSISDELCFARTCYDHLAGKLGVAFTQALLEQEYLQQVDENYFLTSKGLKLAEVWQIDIIRLKKKRRKFAYACLDWSERRFHIAGSLGARITEVFFENKWVNRLPHSRSLTITALGEIILKQEFGIVLNVVD